MVEIDGRTPKLGDIIRLELNPTVGNEQAGYRPVLVISPVAYNRISNLILVCPITSKRKGWPFEVELPTEMQTYRVVLVDQLRSVDCRVRRGKFVEEAPSELIEQVLGKLNTLLG